MLLRQRICGFRGHDSWIADSRKNGTIAAVRLVCVKCGFQTRWFEVQAYRDPAKDAAAWQEYANGLKLLSDMIGGLNRQ